MVLASRKFDSHSTDARMSYQVPCSGEVDPLSYHRKP
jgi:hypothetical protein